LAVLPLDEPGVAIPGGDLLSVLPLDDYPSVLPVRKVPSVNVARPGFGAFLGATWHAIGSFWEWIFGAVTLTLGLALLAPLPILQFLTLGYLLEAGGRIARTGRLRDGFIGVRIAARVGSLVLGTWLMLLPLRFVSSMSLSAQLIEPGGGIAVAWKIFLMVLTGLMVLHIGMACARGGKLRYFLWPFGNPIWLVRRLWRGGYWAEARDAVWDFTMSLRLPYYFWLGLRGFAGAFLWLLIPITLLATGRQYPAVGILMATPLLVAVFLHLPFLQVQFAARNRFREMFNLLGVWRAFGRAPWAFAFSFFISLLFAVPLYLLKIEMMPREIGVLASLVFLIFIFPARLLTGWAYGRSQRRETRRHWFFWLTGPLWMLPIALMYTIIVFFSQYTTWGGVWSLYEQHAFLLPVPFMGM